MPSAMQWAWARERWSAGGKAPDIAQELGVSPQAVQQHMDRHGMPKRYKINRSVRSAPQRWRCDDCGRTCTPEQRCGCVQAWEAA